MTSSFVYTLGDSTLDNLYLIAAGVKHIIQKHDYSSGKIYRCDGTVNEISHKWTVEYPGNETRKGKETVPALGMVIRKRKRDRLSSP